MKVNVLAFGVAKDILGARSVAVEFEGTSTAELRAALERIYPGLRALSSYLLAVNSEYAVKDSEVHTGDEIAIIPPVSGG